MSWRLMDEWCCDNNLAILAVDLASSLSLSHIHTHVHIQTHRHAHPMLAPPTSPKSPSTSPGCDDVSSFGYGENYNKKSY